MRIRKKLFLSSACVLAVIAAVVLIGRQRLSAQGPGTTTLLFGFVTNQVGFDTKFVITNASATPFGNNPTTGTCVINYFGSTIAGGPAPGQQTTTVIPAGTQASFTLSTGGAGIQATPGFQGYVVAACNFPLAQGVAGISDTSASKFLSYLPATVLPAF